MSAYLRPASLAHLSTWLELSFNNAPPDFVGLDEELARLLIFDSLREPVFDLSTDSESVLYTNLTSLKLSALSIDSIIVFFSR